jgi:hypothetical protein
VDYLEIPAYGKPWISTTALSCIRAQRTILTMFFLQCKISDQWVGQGITMKIDVFEQSGVPDGVIPNLESLDLKGMRLLTENQKQVISAVKGLGDEFTAESIRQAWSCGRTYLLNGRDYITDPLLIAVERGNAEARQTEFRIKRQQLEKMFG